LEAGQVEFVLPYLYLVLTKTPMHIFQFFVTETMW